MKTTIRLFLLFFPIVGILGAQYYETPNGYKFYIETASEYTWFEAAFECSYRSMTLFSMESLAQYEDLHDLLTRGELKDRSSNLWLGAVGVKNNFTWLKTGRPLTEHTLWKPGNPDNSGGIENCLHFGTNAKYFNDWACLNKAGFVCQINEAARECISGRSTINPKFNGLTILIKNN